jgi:hypothetical protein
MWFVRNFLENNKIIKRFFQISKVRLSFSEKNQASEQIFVFGKLDQLVNLYALIFGH